MLLAMKLNTALLDIITHTKWNYYRLRSKGDNTFGSVRPSVRLCVCLRSNF